MEMTDTERFKWQQYIRERTKFDPKTGCWNWQLGCDADGYGRSSTAHNSHGFDSRAHRLSFTAFKGPIPQGKMLRHKCHNTPCCNPEHLLVGTAQDNMDDNRRDGRKIGRSRLTPMQAMRIKQLLEQGVLQCVIAAQFGIHATTVNNIRAGRRWARL